MLSRASRRWVIPCWTSRRTLVDLAETKRSWNGRLVISEEVEHALSAGDPVVALESTIITHGPQTRLSPNHGLYLTGMPHPTNLSTAISLEGIIRSHSSIPATIALLDGKVHVGLSKAQLARLADPANGENAVKVSRRDIGATLAMRRMGGTTVAGTMFVASSVGIQVFVTGGIGGVHRGAESSMDISADLIELGRTPMAVVCAGAKSILDIPRTLEVLETQGVCVATYGDQPDFPAFYTPSSGMKSSWMVSDASSAAQLIRKFCTSHPAHVLDASLGLPTPLSTLLAVPIPFQHTEAGDVVQKAVEQAVLESVQLGVDKRGKEVTPWLLKRVGELSGGVALDLNVKLIENNARVGARVAHELAIMRRDATNKHASSSPYFLSTAQPKAAVGQTSLPSPSVLVFGSAAIDLTSSSLLPLSPRSTTPGSIYLSPGGVGRNIAEAAQNLLPPSSVQLVSVIGRQNPATDVAEPDGLGKLLISELLDCGMRTDGLVMSDVAGKSTAACSLTLERDGDLVAGVADMGIIQTMTSEMAISAIERTRPKMVVFDCNLSSECITAILQTCASLKIPTLCDPTSIPKVPRLIPALLQSLPRDRSASRPLTCLSPNVVELDLFHSSLYSPTTSDEVQEIAWAYISALNLTADWRNKVEAFTRISDREWIRTEGVLQKMVACLPFVGSFWVKASHRGLLHLRMTRSLPPRGDPDSIAHRLPGEVGSLVLNHHPAIRIPEDEVVSTTGAGDTFVGGLVAGLVDGREEADLVNRALERVGRTMRSRRAVG